MKTTARKEWETKGGAISLWTRHLRCLLKTKRKQKFSFLHTFCFSICAPVTVTTGLWGEGGGSRLIAKGRVKKKKKEIKKETLLHCTCGAHLTPKPTPPHFASSFHLSDTAWQRQPTLAAITLSLSVISLGTVSGASHGSRGAAERSRLHQTEWEDVCAGTRLRK